ncbi:MAG: hypothetical protein NTW08_02735 [Gammaproteobacteria bacterium]|nr:hypothetical protein [Gammaproteobacteria bacterium]
MYNSNMFTQPSILSREDFITQLPLQIQVRIPGLQARYALSASHMEPKDLIYAVFGISSTYDLSVKHFSGDAYKQDQVLVALIASYQEKMKAIIDHIEVIKQHNRDLAAAVDFPTAILSCMKNNQDDVGKLTTIIAQADLQPQGSKNRAYALRVAATGGALHCLQFLVKHRTDTLTMPGPTSGKIALHGAIENARFSCVSALLNAADASDYFIPAEQLLFGTKPNRPIDFISKIQDPTTRMEMIDLIDNLVFFQHAQDCQKSGRPEINSVLETLRAELEPRRHTMSA